MGWSFMLTCPICGAEPEVAKLEVVNGIFMAGGVRLAEDGFDLRGAKSIHTEDEEVKCAACGRTFALEQCVIPNDPLLPMIDRDLYVLARVACRLCGEHYPLNVARVGTQELSGEKMIFCPDCFAFEALEATQEEKDIAHRRLTERELENHLREATIKKE